MYLRLIRPIITHLSLAMTLLCTGCASFQESDLENLSSESAPLDIQFGLARMMERRGSLTDAEGIYQRIIAQNPTHTQAHHRLGVVLIRTERLDDAISQLLLASKHGAPSADLLGDLGYAYMLKGDIASAEKQLQLAVKQSPDDERLLNNLGMAIGLQGRTEESLLLFRRANSESEAQSNLAFVLARRGERDAAKKHYHLALDRDPELKQAAKGLSEFYQKPTLSVATKATSMVK